MVVGSITHNAVQVSRLLNRTILSYSSTQQQQTQTDEPEDQDIITREDGSMLIDGGMQIDELRELISINDFERHEQDGYSTIAGFVIHYLKKVPRTGEKFSTSGYQFEIMDMDFNRIDKVLISKE